MIRFKGEINIKNTFLLCNKYIKSWIPWLFPFYSEEGCSRYDEKYNILIKTLKVIYLEHTKKIFALLTLKSSFAFLNVSLTLEENGSGDFRR